VSVAPNTGPVSATRPLAVIQTSSSPPPLPVTESASGIVAGNRFAGLATLTPTAIRTLYFSEVLQDPSNPNTSPTNFFITVDGAAPTLFDANNPPAITTTQGATWTHTAGQVGTMSNVRILNNVIDLGTAGSLDPSNRPPDLIVAGNSRLNGTGQPFDAGSVAAPPDFEIGPILHFLLH